VPRGWRLPPNVAEPNNLSLPFHRTSVNPILFLPSSSIQNPPHNMDTSNASSAETDSPITPYEYEPIDDPKGKIRILILLPPASSDDLKLRCHLTTTEISDSPSYEALSYCWGTEALTERIHLPSGTFAITKHLATGLRRLRYHESIFSLLCVE
jgi:hypothetical protein